ncbi:chaplin family protein [Streptomyces microflavus]|uniref:chaplin family protein n=1 Tax=Streptomyces microflavus TaxID=1919 RepID=UPI0036B583E9
MAVAALAVAGIGIVGGAGLADADAGAEGVATSAAAVVFGNAAEAPAHMSPLACDQSNNVVGLLYSASGERACANN